MLKNKEFTSEEGTIGRKIEVQTFEVLGNYQTLTERFGHEEARKMIESDLWNRVFIAERAKEEIERFLETGEEPGPSQWAADTIGRSIDNKVAEAIGTYRSVMTWDEELAPKAATVDLWWDVFVAEKVQANFAEFIEEVEADREADRPGETEIEETEGGLEVFGTFFDNMPAADLADMAGGEFVFVPVYDYEQKIILEDLEKRGPWAAYPSIVHFIEIMKVRRVSSDFPVNSDLFSLFQNRESAERMVGSEELAQVYGDLIARTEAEGLVTKDDLGDYVSDQDFNFEAYLESYFEGRES